MGRIHSRRRRRTVPPLRHRFRWAAGNPFPTQQEDDSSIVPSCDQTSVSSPPTRAGLEHDTCNRDRGRSPGGTGGERITHPPHHIPAAARAQAVFACQRARSSANAWRFRIVVAENRLGGLIDLGGREFSNHRDDAIAAALISFAELHL